MLASRWQGQCRGRRPGAALAAAALVLVAALVGAPPARAAVSFVAAASGGNGAGTTTVTLSKPANVASGDVMLATVTAASTGALTAPAGWTSVVDTTVGTTMRQVTYSKVAGASEPTSYQWSLGTTRQSSGGIADYRGANGTVPVDASAGATGASGNAVAPSVTTSAAGATVVAAVAFAKTTTVTPDASTVERYDTSSSGTATEAADFTQASAGATATKTAIPASTGAAWIAQTVALRDAAQATLAVSTSATPSFSANLNSGDQTPTYTVPSTVNDTRTGASAGLGWNLTITSTQFTTGSRTLATNASSVTAVTSACANGGLCVTPTNAIAYPVTVPAGSTPPTAVKFFNAAAATGEGVFTITPTVRVSVPQNSFAGSYASTLTLSVVSGP